MEWFTSDTHFSHEAIIHAHQRPFRNTVEMDDVIIGNINRLVKKSDTLYHLGDFAYGSVEKGIKLRKRINCQNVFLIYGNHDEKNRTFREFRRAFGKGHCHDILEIRRDGQLYVMCHYPFLYSHHWDKGAINVHGHMHGEGIHSPEMPTVDVGVDIWNFRPISILEVRKVVEEGIYKLPYEERLKALNEKEEALCQL